MGQHYSVKPVELVFEGSAYSPVYYKNQIIFCSDHKDRVFHTIVDENGLEPVDLYLFHPDTLSVINKFSPLFRTDYHDGPITFNEKADYCVVSRNLVTDEKYKTFQKDSNWLGLYTSKYSNGSWDSLTELPFNSVRYNCTHPFLSANGDTLLFASTMPGGYGGYDIWKSVIDNNQWGKPQNLGEKINSSDHELFPSINNNTIYISSNKEGLGGLDIYYSNLNDLNDSLHSFASPINSEFDDFGIISKDNGITGYLSSNRKGKGQDQIWSFQFNYPDFQNCDTLVKDVFCYTLYEENAKEIGSVDALVYEWKINDEIVEGVEIYYCFPGPGDYEITLNITDTIIHKTYYEQAYYYISLAHTVQPFIESPDTVQVGLPFNLSADKSNLPDVEIIEYYWDFGDDTRAKGIKQDHHYNTAGTYTVQLGAIGTSYGDTTHNCVIKNIVVQDSLATQVLVHENMIPEQINDTSVVQDFSIEETSDSTITVYSIELLRSATELTEEEFIYKFLRGINEDLENVEDEEVLAFFKAMSNKDFLSKLLKENKIQKEYIEDEDVYSYLTGHWIDVQMAHATWQNIQNNGISEAVLRSFNVTEIDGLALGASFELDHLYFDSDKWNIKKDVEADLNLIFNVLREYSFVKLDINAYTDATATKEHNLQLSKNRANAVLKYLTTKGINKDRLNATGFGEENPVGDNNTEEGKQKNRRVEFKLVIE